MCSALYGMSRTWETMGSRKRRKETRSGCDSASAAGGPSDFLTDIT